MRKLKDYELVFYKRIMDKINNLDDCKCEVLGSQGLRIHLDYFHTITMEKSSKRKIYVALNKFERREFIFGGYVMMETEVMNSINIHKWRNKDLFNEIETIRKRLIGHVNFVKHLEKQREVNKVL